MTERLPHVALLAAALAPAILGGFKKQAQSQATGLEGLGGQDAVSGGSGLASRLDLDGDGNPPDEILQMAGKAMRSWVGAFR